MYLHVSVGILVPSLGHDLSFPQTEVCTKPGVVGAVAAPAGIRYRSHMRALPQTSVAAVNTSG